MPDRKVTKQADPRERILDFPMAANAVISIGDIVVLNTATVATGVAERASTALTLTGLGIAVEAKDNTGGAAGDERIHVSTAPHALALEAGALDYSDLGATVYAVDELIVDGDDAGGTRSAYGVLTHIDADGNLFIRPTIASL